jgi:hypothetical protein
MAAAVDPRKPGFSTGTGLSVRVLALCHLAAFGSFWIQERGLVGPEGILPAGQLFQVARERLGARAVLELPSLCWVFGTGRFLDVLCIAGIAASVLLFAGRAQALCLAVLWSGYLSLLAAGQQFFEYQWDNLLLECTLLAVFLVPWRLWRSEPGYEPPKLARFLVWWLIFRLMVMSGISKLASGDTTWRNLTALTYHFQTQPLPTPLAWYAHHLPLWLLKASCAGMFAIELLAPLCLPAPRSVRHASALAMVALQLVIAATGNYAFFNLLSGGLCLTCVDDRAWARVLPGAAAAPAAVPEARAKPHLLRWFAAASVGLTFFLTVAVSYPGAARSPLARPLFEALGPLRSFNTYGLFAVMTLERPELVIEGSTDGTDWREYGLPYKPVSLSRPPLWAAPYQPRLDWQLWFAALESPDDNAWVGALCARLLAGDRAVLGLFSRNPFPAHPPRFVRVVRYIYEFTDPSDKARTGNWWRRTPIDFYTRPMSLPEATR